MPSKARKYLITTKSPDNEHRRLWTLTRDSKDEAVAEVEALEAEYAAFRLDEQDTLDRYPALDSDSLARVEETTIWVPEDEVLLDGRFVRGGKVIASGAPGYLKQHKGWRAFHEQENAYEVERAGAADVTNVVTGGMYGVPVKNLMTAVTNGVWDWDTDTIKCALTTSAYTVDIDTHDFFNDVTNEVTGTGYTAGGATLASTAGTYDTATDQARLDAADTSWTTSTITARRAVVYKSTGTGSTSPLISFLDFGAADVSTTAGTFLITWDATGIVVVDVT